ncbi:GNAT family N-acetyltransferase [Salipaludibacillus keqinensis]|uniref:GNAT family N-acetyltransferase n=1 Tax=Salipaludibacillus keqinensis TaxID=2045207 RepID=A0A323TS98_9BACI|nr:GNAT family N-acetyltransferase [Salipaludibacillus keqinensis]PYZ92285.1 GNAT family N-acetyltransferase [Salipaludibacillus keqinensis]
MNPILRDFPNEFETDHLLIRLPKPGDGPAVNEALKASINELKQWLPFAYAQQEPTVEDTEINVREAHLKFLKREDLRLHIFHKKTLTLVGCTGLHRIDWDVPKFEIGYWVDTRFTGEGYITEAVEGLSKFAFSELNGKRLEIRCDAKNMKSRAVPERLGFPLEGVLKNDDRSVDGKELRDTCVYAKIAEK